MRFLKPRLFALTILVSVGAQAQKVPFGFFKNQTDKLAFTTTAQSLSTYNCSAITTVQSQNATGASKNVGSNLTVSLTAVSGVTYFSDSNCTTSITSVTIASGASSASFYFLSSSSGTKSIAAAATAYTSGAQNQTLTASPFIWTGGGANANWSTAGNWSGGAAPSTTSDVAIFEGSCVTNCSPTVNASISIGGIRVESAYSGTITQSNGFTITLASAGWVHAGGTFTGGNSNIVLNGPFVLTGGTFTSTTASLSIYRDFLVSGSPTFNHNSGTTTFNGANSGTYSLTPGSLVFYTVAFGGNNVTHTLTGTLTVNGALTLSDVNNGKLNTGTIEAKGNVTTTSTGKSGTALIRMSGNTNQTFTGTSGSIGALEIAATGGSTVTMSGTVTVTRNYTWTSGTISPGSSTLYFSGQPAVNTTITPGTETYGNVSFHGNNTTHTLIGTMTVTGLLTLNDSNGSIGTLDTGTIEAKGDVTFLGYGKKGTGNLKIIGTGGAGTQTLTGVSTSAIPNIEINTAGTVNLSGTFNFAKTFLYTAGTVSPGTSTVMFTTAGQSITQGAITFNNVTFSTNNATQSFSGTMTVGGTLTLNGVNVSNSTVNTGSFDVSGDFVASGSGYAGTATVNFVGASSKTMTIASTSKTLAGMMTINKTGGATMSLTSNTSLTSGQSVTITAGTLDMAGYNLTVNGNITNSGTLKRGNSPSCGTLSYTGSFTGSAAVCP